MIPKLLAEKIRIISRVKARNNIWHDFKDMVKRANDIDMARLRALDDEVKGIELLRKVNSEHDAK